MKSLFCSIVLLLMLAGPNPFEQTSVFAQRDENEVLAQGNPPLTLGLSDKLVEFFEWGLDSKFTKSQRALFTLRLLQIWEKPDKPRIGVLVNARKHFEDLATKKKEERDEAQRLVQTHCKIINQSRSVRSALMGSHTRRFILTVAVPTGETQPESASGWESASAQAVATASSPC